MTAPDDAARLIHEVLTQLGWDAEPDEVARRVRRLDYGLPAEDEFSVVCAWLGHCELVHKLDQQQAPIASKALFQVPDLLAKFHHAPSVLIEVKVSNDQTLSFKPDYHRKLVAYAEMVGMPLLIAWKFNSMWTLFDIGHAKLARKNFNIRHDEAMRQNLMGLLARDVAYVAAVGAGIHLKIAKEELIQTREDEEGVTETWQMRLTEMNFSVGGGEVRELHRETKQLFTTLALESHEDHSPTYIVQSFVVDAPNQGQFAHRALVSLLEWEHSRDSRPQWRAKLGAADISRTIGDFQTALDRALEEGVVTHIFHQVPAIQPDFLTSEASQPGRVLDQPGRTRPSAPA